MVSVIIPNYNHASFLRQRIHTVLNQTVKPQQLIILDDCSTDDSNFIINEFAINHPNISVHYNQQNSGSTFHQWNKGIELATQDWIWIAESDDMADEQLLEKLIAAVSADEKNVIAFAQSYRMNDLGDITGTWASFIENMAFGEVFQQNFVMNGKDFIEKFLIHKNVIPNASAVLFKKSAYLAVGGADATLKTNGDWLLWLKMLCKGNLAFVSKPLNYFRFHDKSVIAKAHQLKNTRDYQEQYDYTMRLHFHQFKKSCSIVLSKQALKLNNHYMSLDLGYKAVHDLRLTAYKKGWLNLLKASFQPTIKTIFFKKLMGWV